MNKENQEKSMNKNSQTEPPSRKNYKKANDPGGKKEKGNSPKKQGTPEQGDKWYKPKKFFWKYPLEKGVKIISILMILVMVICIISTCTNAGIIGVKFNTKDLIVINALACTLTELAFSILMLIIHVLLFLSLKWENFKKKNNVLVSWIAIQAIWLIHKTCLVLIAMLLFLKVLNIALWAFIFILAIAALVILFYFWLVVHSYWSRLKVKPGK